MEKAQFLRLMRSKRAEWETLIAPLDETHLTQPRSIGDWSIKDIIAHISWYDQQMIESIETRALVGSDLWALDLDERNAIIYEQNKDRTLEDVRAEAAIVFPRFLAAVETLTQEELDDARHFRSMPPDWSPADVIASNAHEHYTDHINDAKKWLARA
jgi:hypothetical protein